MVRRFRKKPVVIEAFQWGVDRIPDWFAGHKHCTTGQYYINTLEGRMYINDGDYIIKGVAGEQYPCKPDIFNQTYQEVYTTDNRGTEPKESVGGLARCGKCNALLLYNDNVCPECLQPVNWH